MTLRRRVSRAAAGRCRQCESLRERCRRHPLFQPNVVSCLQPVPLPDVLQTSRDVPIDSSSALSISFFFEGRTFAGRPGLLVAAHYCWAVEAASAVYETTLFRVQPYARLGVSVPLRANQLQCARTVTRLQP